MDLAQGNVPGVAGVGLNIGTLPAKFCVEEIPQRVIGLLPARGSDVKALATLKLHPRGDDVDVPATVLLAVPNGIISVLARFKTGKGQLLKAGQHLLNLLAGRPVVWMPRDDGRSVGMHEL